LTSKPARGAAPPGRCRRADLNEAPPPWSGHRTSSPTSPWPTTGP
jgi:hypothetical protein